jgi:hypothetical protein
MPKSPSLVALAVLAASCAAPVGPEAPARDESALTERSPFDVCADLAPDAPERAQGMTVRAKGVLPTDDGSIGAVVSRLYRDRAACQAAKLRPVPKAYFYGNLGTWGWLGLDDRARSLRTSADVVARFGQLCEEARRESGLGAEMPCHADLIAVSPRGWVRPTEQVAKAILDAHPDATLSLDVRERDGASFATVAADVERLFDGSSWMSREVLARHPFGLSLDLEPQIGPNGGNAVASAVSAATVNAMCDAYRDRMIALGHPREKLTCFLYEYAKPTMVKDPQNLSPWIFPVLMSSPTITRTRAELVRRTPADVAARGLAIAEEWVDIMRRSYASSGVHGCMFFQAGYLTDGQRNPFTYADAAKAFGGKCDIHSFQ